MRSWIPGAPTYCLRSRSWKTRSRKRSRWTGTACSPTPRSWRRGWRISGFSGKVVEVRPGPVVTMYEYEPAPGVKINKIVSLCDDLALALRAISVRIVAPIPGKAAVGIEIPNSIREPVYLKDILVTEDFSGAESKLTLALGKDIFGNPFVTNLGKMPHLLVAGATGTGKSVSLNSMICSLLYKSDPEEVKLLMIDPKRLELSIYDGIPHLLHSVVYDPKAAAQVLRWATQEMEVRYRLMAEKGVRNIERYNQKVEKEEKEQRKKACVLKEDGPGRRAQMRPSPCRTSSSSSTSSPTS